jgi:hypothetical protein
MLHRNVKGRGILLRLTRNCPLERIESSDRVIEESFTTFHNRTCLKHEPLRNVCGFQPLPEKYIKMFNYIIISEDGKVGHQEVFLMI